MAKTALLVLALRACALVPPGARRAAAPRRRAAAVLRARSLDGFLDSTPAAKAFYDGAAPARRRTPSSRRRRRAGRFREFRVDVRRPVDATRRPRRAASAIRGRPPPRSVVGVGPRPHRGCRRQHRGAAADDARRRRADFRVAPPGECHDGSGLGAAPHFGIRRDTLHPGSDSPRRVGGREAATSDASAPATASPRAGVDGGALKQYSGDKLGDASIEDQTTLSAVVDFLHTELMKKSVMADYVEEEAPLGDEFDDFIEEGRKLLAISHSRVASGGDEAAVAGTVWAALGELFTDETPDSGLLCAMPDFPTDVATFLTGAEGRRRRGDAAAATLLWRRRGGAAAATLLW